MKPVSTNYNLPNIRTLLIEGFSDEELRRLCYDSPIFKSVYDELAQNSGKTEIVDRLIDYADRKILLKKLLSLAKKHNPARYKKHQPYSITTSTRPITPKLRNKPKPPCPYPGMVPFRAEDTRFFYGREAEIRQMLWRLRDQRYLFVIGPSGSGKSSLVSAGLLPRLLNNSLFPNGFGLVREIRPGSRPYLALAQAIGGDPAQPDLAVTNLLAGRPSTERLLLVIDQFEELFTQVERAEQSRFIAALQTLRLVENCTLLITMRADFYPDLMNSDLWPVKSSQRLEIAPLWGKALRQAIQQPAADVEVRLEANLVERLLADAADEPGVLPLVQETMVLLWEIMQDRLLTLNDYEGLGEGRSGLATAMVTKADATLDRLLPPQQAIARRIFLRLIQFGEGRADTRRQLPVNALKVSGNDPLLFEQTLRHLTNNRLLTLSGEEQEAERKVDIAHEALIIGWPTLQRWLQERREAEQTRRRLETKVSEWIHWGRGGGGLLDEVGLIEAERWLNSPDANDLGYDESLLALVRTSRVAIEEAERERKAAQLQKRLVPALSTLNEIGQMLTYGTQLKQDEILELVCEQTCKLTGTQEMYIALYDESTRMIRFGLAVAQGKRINIAARQANMEQRGKTEEVIFTRQPLLHKTQEESERWYKMPGHADLLGKVQASYIAVPMLWGQKVLGVIAVYDWEREYVYDELDLQVLSAIASQAVIALNNANLFQMMIASQQLAALGTATAAIQHRINNTLNIIGPNITRLRKRVNLEDETIQEILDLIERNTKNTSNYINRIQEPLIETEVQTIDINSILREVETVVWRYYSERVDWRTIEIVFNLEDSLPWIEASSSQIAEIFRNLIENGYKAMGDKGGTLTIASRQVDNWVEVKVQDTGPGIPPEIRDRLFVKPVPSRQPGQSGQGSGLGLWLSALLLQKYAGEIKIADTGPGGTTVLVRLPISKG